MTHGGLMDLIKTRRSYRKYADLPVESEKLEALKTTCAEAAHAFGSGATRFVFVQDPRARRRFIRAATSGLYGKINPWMYLTKAPYFVALVGYPNRAKRHGDREMYLAEASMAMECLMLAAASLGLATCWMAGYGERALSRALNIPNDARIIAITPVGYPPERAGVSMDSVTRLAVSKRRKPLEAICFFHE